MSEPKRANDLNNMPCWKVRICMRGGPLIHLLSKTEPVVLVQDGRIEMIVMDLITGTEHGDTLGFIDWSEIKAVSWRFAPLATA
jgi:hypothetical protein